jgi:hypothetical protein
MSGNVSVLVTKNVDAVRGARRGRMYIGGVSESVNDTFVPNTMLTSQQTTWQAAFNAFLGDSNQTPGTPTTYSARMCVPHIVTRYPPKPNQDIGSPHTGIDHLVGSLSVQSRLATQRRRLRG